MKLHQLAYLCQIYSLEWDKGPLFREKVEAWCNGPIIRELFEKQDKQDDEYYHTWPEGNVENLAFFQGDTIEAILAHYGSGDWNQLKDLLTREGSAWKSARKDMDPRERGSVEITHTAMRKHYSKLEGKKWK
jgi:uncharacterized phage-associated protein